MHFTLRHNHCHVMTFLFSTRTSKLGVAAQFAGNCMLSIGENSSFETATFRQKRMRWMTQSGASSMMYVRLREGKPGTSLVARTHSESPWLNARSGMPNTAPCNAIISKDSISAYYRLDPIITAERWNDQPTSAATVER